MQFFSCWKYSFQISSLANRTMKSVFRKTDKLVALPVYSSFRRVATSLLRLICVFTHKCSQVKQIEGKWGVNTDSHRFQYSITTHLVGWIDCDVTGLIATELPTEQTNNL